MWLRQLHCGSNVNFCQQADTKSPPVALGFGAPGSGAPFQCSDRREAISAFIAPSPMPAPKRLARREATFSRWV